MMKKLSTLPLLVFVVLVAPLQAIAQQQQPPPTAPQPPYIYWPGPWHMWADGGGFQFWWICPLMMLFMFLIFGIIFFFVRRSKGSHHWGPPWHMMHGGPPTNSALQILNERFARGEIQKDEYEEKKGAILSGGLR